MLQKKHQKNDEKKLFTIASNIPLEWWDCSSFNAHQLIHTETEKIEFSWPNRKFIMTILKWCARDVMILCFCVMYYAHSSAAPFTMQPATFQNQASTSKVETQVKHNQTRHGNSSHQPNHGKMLMHFYIKCILKLAGWLTGWLAGNRMLVSAIINFNISQLE